MHCRSRQQSVLALQNPRALVFSPNGMCLLVVRPYWYIDRLVRWFLPDTTTHHQTTKEKDKKQEEFLKNTNIARNFLYQQIKDIAPQSCFVEMIEKKRKSLTIKPKTTLPLGIKEQAGIYKVDTNISQQDNITNFTKSILLNQNEIKIIEAHTKEQSKTDLWYKQRIGRITASKVHSVVTRMETLRKTESTDAHNLVGSLLHSKPFENYATRHGIATEPHAKRALVQVLKANGHKKVKFEDMGTVISEEYPFLSASPDLQVSCECCGTGLVEIKCPYSIRDRVPNPSELKQIAKRADGSFSLKQVNGHYYQIQSQLGITKLRYCYYFVFTHHGNYIEKITFNKNFYDNILKDTITFCYQHFCKELLYPTQQAALEVMDTGTTKTNKKIVVLKRNKVAKKGKQKKSKSMPEAVYLSMWYMHKGNIFTCKFFRRKQHKMRIL